MNGDQHSFLIILRLSKGADPLRCGSINEQGKFEPVERGTGSLVIGVVDPSKKGAGTPTLTLEFFDKDVCGRYNTLLNLVHALNQLYAGENGYLSNPGAFTQQQQTEVSTKIREIGFLIHALLETKKPNSVLDWINHLFKYGRHGDGGDAGAEHHVTIITNDFGVPWYWLNHPYHDQFLCEVVSLGMVQLRLSAVTHENVPLDWRVGTNAGPRYKALLVNALPALPFGDVELQTVNDALNAKDGDSMTAVGTHMASTLSGVNRLFFDHPKESVWRFRLVHFLGPFVGDELGSDNDIAGSQSHLPHFIDRSFVVIDGCSGSEGLCAWTDIERITTHLISSGAVGCLVPVLPAKNDPIVAEIFWPAFYTAVRTPGVSLGQALLRSRHTCKERLRKLGSSNPAWVLYQLIGSPSMELFAEPADQAELQ